MTTNIKDRFASLPKDDDSVYRSALITATAKQGGTVVEQVKADASAGVEHIQNTANPHGVTLAQVVDGLTSVTTPSNNDYLLVYSASTMRWHKILFSNLLGTPRESKSLGASIPTAGVDTALYTVPTGKTVTDVTVFVCNQAATASETIVAVVPSGQTVGPVYYILDTTVGAKESVQVSGISLVAGDKIYVKSVGTSSVSYQAFGEVSV